MYDSGRLIIKKILKAPFINLWTGGTSYAPYRSLSISKLFCKDGGGGGGKGVEGFVMNSQPTSGPKKVSISGPTPSNGPRYGFPPFQNVPPHKNSRYINNYYVQYLLARHIKAELGSVVSQLGFREYIF